VIHNFTRLNVAIVSKPRAIAEQIVGANGIRPFIY
jgi:hypothetical protein